MKKCFTSSLLGLAASALSQSHYHLTLLDPDLTPGAGNSFAYAVNGAGHATGIGTDAGYNAGADMWSNGAITEIGGTSWKGSQASGINDSDEVVGYVPGSGFNTDAFYWKSGALHNLEQSSWIGSWANGVDNAGNVIGNYVAMVNGHQVIPGTIWHADGTRTDLNSLVSVADGASPRGIASTTGEAVGIADAGFGAEEAVYWKTGAVNPTALPGLNTSFMSGARQVNNLGDIVGSYADSSFQYYEGGILFINGQMTTIPGLSNATAEYVAINDSREVLVTSTSAAGQYSLWDATHGVRSLNGMIDNLPSNAFLNLTTMNNNGVIVGQVIVGGYYHAAMLTPTPEPETCAGIGAGLWLLLWRRRRQSRTRSSVSLG